MKISTHISLLVIAVAIVYKHCCMGQGADCYSDLQCSSTSTFGTIQECCNSSSTPRSFQRQGGSEACEECQFTYRCYVSEQCSSNPMPEPVTSFAINDGERICCNGTFTSWNMDDLSCNTCPEPVITTSGITVPLTTTEMETPDSSTMQSNPDITVNVSPAQSAGCSAGCITGIVVGCVVAVILIIAAIVIITVVLIVRK